MDAEITINAELCKKDGLCQRICQGLIFSAEEKQVPSVRFSEHCCLCGHCVAICPAGAIHHGGLDAGRFSPIDQQLPVDPDAFIQTLKQRRSIRNYKDRPIPRELLEEVASAAGYAPGAAHMGVGWERHVTVVTGEQQMQQVRAHTVEHFSDEAKVVRKAILPDTINRLRVLEKEQRDGVIWDAPAAIFVHATSQSVDPVSDYHAAIMTILLAAHVRGLGACWNGWLTMACNGDHQRGFTQLKEFLGVPEDHVCHAACTIGYPRLRDHSGPSGGPSSTGWSRSARM